MRRNIQNYIFKMLIAGALALAITSCKEKEEPVIVSDNNFRVQSGNNQQGTIGLYLDKDIVFKVTDADRENVEGEWIYFEKDNDIQIAQDSISTNAHGNASIQWKMNDEEGACSFFAYIKQDGEEKEGSRIEIKATANSYGYFIDERNTREYKFVKIGDQYWMAENLDYGEPINGDELPANPDIVEKYYYTDDVDLGATYGGLYTWDEAMAGSPADDKLVSTTQGICPDGWHIPSYDEWFDLMQFVGNSPKKLKSTEGWNIVYDTVYVMDTITWEYTDEIARIDTFDYNGTDDYGFRGLGAGYKGLNFNEANNSYYWTEGVYSYYWATNEYSWDPSMARIIGIYGPTPDIFDSGHADKINGMCIRCVMNEQE